MRSPFIVEKIKARLLNIAAHDYYLFCLFLFFLPAFQPLVIKLFKH